VVVADHTSRLSSAVVYSSGASLWNSVPRTVVGDHGQIQELLRLFIIKHSKSEMGSPIVCVLKGKDGKDGIRITIDYQHLNKYCVGIPLFCQIYWI